MNQGWLVWVWVQRRGKGVPAYLLIPDVHLSLSPAAQGNGWTQTDDVTIRPETAGLRSPLTLWLKPPTGHMTTVTIRTQRHHSRTEKRVISLQTLEGTKACFASRFFWKRQIRGMRKEMFPLFLDLFGSRGVRAVKQNYKGTQCGSSDGVWVRHWKISSLMYDWLPQWLCRLHVWTLNHTVYDFSASCWQSVQFVW